MTEQKMQDMSNIDLSTRVLEP